MLRKYFIFKNVDTVSVFPLINMNYDSSSSTQGKLIKPSHRANRFEKYLIIASVIESWNKLQKQLKNTLLKELSTSDIKTVTNNIYLQSY